MSGSVKDFRGRNGILRKFAHPLVDDVLSSKVSQDGTFCAALTHRGLLSFPTLTSQPVKVHVPGEINGFVEHFWYVIPLCVTLDTYKCGIQYN